MNEEVAAKVGMPGLALAGFGGFALLSNILGLLVWFVSMGLSFVAVASTGDSDVITQFIIQSLFGIITGLLFPILSLVGNSVIIFGGLRLRNAQSAGLVYAAAILALLPCCSGSVPLCGIPCCCVGIWIAIWAIVVMQDEQVKSAFASNG